MNNSHALILTVDDDRYLLDFIEQAVTEWGHAYRSATNAKDMWRVLEQAIPNVLLLDIQLGSDNGMSLVAELTERYPSVPVIMTTVQNNVETVVQCMRNGAYDFVGKPINQDRLHVVIDKALEHNTLSLQVRAYEHVTTQADFHGIIGRSDSMRKIYRLIENVAPTDASVLITGESGTGKELVARALHACSGRAHGPFVAVNAPAIPHELIESALFGHEKGAFTGAGQQHLGFCEQANGGTLFLDEICEMEYQVQAKLLRFLQDHTLQRVGGRSTQSVDVRVLAATNRDPKQQIRNGKLREDLFYRLSVINVELADLHDRPGDIGLLADYFLGKAAAQYGRPLASFTSEALHLLDTYAWPGNVRQLEHMISQLVITNNSTELDADMLPTEITQSAFVSDSAIRSFCLNSTEPCFVSDADIPSIKAMEEHLIIKALEVTNGNVGEAAKHLGISEATLYRKIKKLGLARTFSSETKKSN